jgi:hypothetical protein
VPDSAAGERLGGQPPSRWRAIARSERYDFRRWSPAVILRPPRRELMPKVTRTMIRVVDLHGPMRFYADLLALRESHRPDLPDFALWCCGRRLEFVFFWPV